MESSNLLLQLIGGEAVAKLGATHTVSLSMRERLDGPGEAAVYFIETGVASVIADLDGKFAVELGIIGREGMVGLHVIYGDTENAYQTMVQVEGIALQVDAGRLARLIDKDKAVRAVMLNFARAFSIQVAGTALANGRNKLDERLARWLVMVGDRAGMTFAITHEFIAIMLGVRRSGVTIAIQILEGQGLIRASRGSITILRRDGLVVASKGAYGFAEDHYKRLLGVEW